MAEIKCQSLFGAVLLTLTVLPVHGEETSRCVRFVYLVSRDREVVTELNLVPEPHLVESLDGQPWRLGAAMRVRVPEQIPKVREHFQVVAGVLKMLADKDTRFVDQVDEADLVVVVEPTLPADAYVLRVRDDGVQIEASSVKGITRATATLLQLIGQYRDTAIPALQIRDEPDCSYRNFMIDVGRNPHSLESLKETIDLLWFYKVDSMQIHLTDDQRFAFPSKAYPKLVTQHGKITWKQFAELERYAQARGVAIIPELEVPGHSGILRRTYPEVFGGSPTDLATLETARKSIKKLLDEMIELFPSSPYIHIGGDEADAYFNARACESYRVLVSRDGEEFVEVGNRLDKPSAPTAFINHDFEPQQVRYIKVESDGCKQNVFDSFSRLIEIQAFSIEQ